MYGLDCQGKQVFWHGDGEVLCVEPYGEDIIRVRATKNRKITEESWTLLPPEADSALVEQSEAKVILKNGKLVAEILADGTITFLNQNGQVLLEEYWIDERALTVPVRRAREYRAVSSNQYKLAQYFKPQKGERFYGMGTYRNNCFNLKGTTLGLCHKNTQSSIPVLYSSKGYGLIWNNPSVGQAELVNNHTMFSAEAAQQLDYLITAGDSPDEINENLTQVTGRSPELPEWAAGFWQCKLRYETQDEVLRTAREYKRRGLPISVIVIDFFHWTEQGDWKFDPECFPEPEAMLKELHEMGIKVMVSIWPTVDPSSENFEELKRNDYLLKSEKGVSVFFMFNGPETYYDPTHPGARDFVWSKANENYFQKGVDMFWLDEAEPELRPYDYDHVRYHLGNGLEVTNLFPFYYAKTFADGMKAEGREDIVNLIRCCWLGSQRFGVVAWSGDIPSTFQSLEEQMKIGLNMSLTGISWWTTDIGGFFGGDPTTPEFRELFVRWFQYGVFCPIFRNHGFRLPMPPWNEMRSGGPNEVWDYGEEAYPILVKYMELREQLKPYILEQMKIASRTGRPVMRPLFYDFHQDETTFEIEDQFMFGDNILVAPVYEAQCTSRKVYLPEGSSWINVFSKDSFTGGQWVDVDTPLDQIPLFSRNGMEISV